MVAIEFEYSPEDLREAQRTPNPFHAHSPMVVLLLRSLAGILLCAAVAGAYLIGNWALDAQAKLTDRERLRLGLMCAMLLAVALIIIRNLIRRSVIGDWLMFIPLQLRRAIFSLLLMVSLLAVPIATLLHARPPTGGPRVLDSPWSTAGSSTSAPVVLPTARQPFAQDPNAVPFVLLFLVVAALIVVPRMSRAWGSVNAISASGSYSRRSLRVRRRLTATAEGLYVEINTWHRHLPWARICGFGESTNLVYVYFTDRSRMVLPKRAFTWPALQEFHSLLCANVQPAPGTQQPYTGTR